MTPIIHQHNPYLLQTETDIKNRTIPWEGYHRASLITEQELAQIRTYEKDKKTTLDTQGETYILLFLSLLQKLVRTDTIQNILVLIDDILEEDESRCQLFLNLTKTHPGLPFSPFFRLLYKEDEYITLKSAKICTTLLINIPRNPLQYDPTDLFTWCSSQLRNPNPLVVDIAVQYLQSLCSIHEYKQGFYDSKSGIAILIDILKKENAPQMQYQIIYILWSLSYVDEIAADMQQRYDVIPRFLEIAKSAIKEKVVRVIVATLKNMVLKAPKENMVALMGNKTLDCCHVLSLRKWSDEEILVDLEFLKDELNTSVSNLSTFDEYSSEVKTGNLDWSPAHNSEAFWKLNSVRLSEKNYELVKKLGEILATNTNPTALAVAAHDIGQYVKYCPTGKKILDEIGVKTRIMQLMTHSNGEVQFNALIAVQKMMQHAWSN